MFPTIDDIKTALNATSVGVAFSTLVGWLPAIAALFSIMWTGLQIYSWFEKRRLTRQAKRGDNRKHEG